jgi:hypothetical protein
MRSVGFFVNRNPQIVKLRSLFSLSLIAIGNSAVLLLTSFVADAQTPSPSLGIQASLKGKTDQELVELLTGRKLPAPPDPYINSKDRIDPSPLDRAWEMPPAEAALALVSDHMKHKVSLKIDDPKAEPPKKGEIGLRWVSGGHYGPPRHGVTILKYDGYKSQLLVSEVEVNGEASKDEIERAVMKTDAHKLNRLVARQTYKMLWWLGHVRVQGESNIPSLATVPTYPDVPTRFWIEPGGIVLKGFETDFFHACGECLAAGNKAAYAEFAEFLLLRLLERSGIQDRYPMPTIGRHVDRNDDETFLHTPSPDDATALQHWIGRLIEILRNPERQELHSTIMERLVPTSEPLRYSDPRIDDAMLVLMHRGLEASARLKRLEDEPDGGVDRTRERRRLSESESNAFQAVYRLGFHDATKAFDELFALAKKPAEQRAQQDAFLIAAASIAGRHPDLRSPLAEYLTERLTTEQDIVRLSPLFQAVWRADVRELTPSLEKVAAGPPPASDPRETEEIAREASQILTAWRETDPLTKTKIDALLTILLGEGAANPEVLRAEFEALSGENKFQLRQFITWLRTADPTVQLHYLESTFTPQMPRPDIPYEQ